MSTNTPVITRFAPSPTGFMHIGGIRTALYAYFIARQSGGVFILRIEDTDKEREVAGSIGHIQDSLSWLGIDWDYGPEKAGPFGSCIQSERLHVYKKYADMLVEKGLAYPDPYTKEEIDEFRELAKQEKRPFLYRNHRPKTFEAWDGTKPLRLKVSDIKRHHWHDLVRGDLEGGEEMLDDIILIKTDGYPTYNFAHIVDDYEMGVTHIVRGDEFISSTPKFLSVYEALDITPPEFVSLPPILRDDRSKKLGKRDGAKDILEYKSEGYLPETMVNFLSLIGWNPGTDDEKFSISELLQLFTIEKIGRAGAAFNEEKLLWLNKKYIEDMSSDEFFSYTKNAIPDDVLKLTNFSDEQLEKLLPVVRERVHIAKEITEAFEAGEYDFAFLDPKIDPVMLLPKKETDLARVSSRLKHTSDLLGKIDFGSADAIKATIWDYAESEGRAEVLWPLRVALTGKERSPDPFTVAYIIGKESTLKRIENACDTIAGNAA